MVDYRFLSLAEVLMHPKHGLVSNQPDISKPISEFIRVQDVKGRFHGVRASDCRLASKEETEEYRNSQPKPR